MRVFISWSGERSHKVAQVLSDRLPLIINAIDPWLSSADIESGANWTAELASGLQETDFGILCLAPDNLTAPWLLFEAGALSKQVGKARVTPYLLDLKPTDVKPPLGQFQAVEADREGTEKLVGDLAKAVRRQDQAVLTEIQLAEQFENWWPKIEETLSEIPDNPDEATPERPQGDILDEILSIVRSEARESKVGTPIVQRARRRPLSDSQRLSQLREERDYIRQKINSAVDKDDYFMWTKDLISITEQIDELENPPPPEWLIESEITEPDE